MDSPRNRGLVSDSLLNLGGHAVPMFVALASLPLIVSHYRLEQFGLLSLSWTLLGSFAYLDLGMGRATVQAVARLLVERDGGNIRGVVWGSLIASVGSGILGSIIIFFGSPFLVTHLLTIPSDWAGEATAVFSVTGLAFPLITATSVFRGLLEAAQRFDVVNAIKAPANSLVLLIPVIGIPFSWDLPTVVLVTVVSRLITLLAYAAASWYFMRFAVSFLNVSFSGFSEVLTFGGWVMLTNILTPVIGFSDRLILVAFVPLEHVAFYTAPFELISRFPVLAASVAQGLFPIFSGGGIADPESQATDLLTRVVKILLVVMAPAIVLVIAFSGEGLEYWLGDGWADRSTIVLQLLSVGFFFNSLGYVYLAAVHGSGRADLKAKLDMILAVLTVSSCWVLVRVIGFEGAAVARLVLFAADVSLLVIFTRRISGLSWGELLPPELIKGMIICLAAMAIASVLNVALPESKARVPAVILLLVVLSWISWRHVARPDERTMVLSFINKIALRHPR